VKALTTQIASHCIDEEILRASETPEPNQPLAFQQSRNSGIPQPPLDTVDSQMVSKEIDIPNPVIVQEIDEYSVSQAMDGLMIDLIKESFSEINGGEPFSPISV